MNCYFVSGVPYMSDSYKWYFTSNGNGQNTGLNDAGITTFADSHNWVNPLVRETIQNSLDAVLDKEKPVEVEFRNFLMNRSDFPGYEEFKSVLQACYDEQKEYSDAEKFFNRARDIFTDKNNSSGEISSGKFISVLRMSDFNTKGLEGADTNSNNGTWGRLVKGNGVSNQGITAGGSFGIGKSSSFGCSELRTVFYASLDKNNIKSYIGVTRLVTFKDEKCKGADNPDGLTTGIGYYAQSNLKNAILKLPDFEQGYLRTTSGTDIYIMGMVAVDNIKNTFIDAVLNNFLVSLWDNKLVVRLKFEDEEVTLNQSNVKTYIEQMVERKKEGTKSEKEAAETIQNYYDALTLPESDVVRKIALDTKEYGDRYGFQNGDAILYLLKKEEGETVNRKLLVTRDAGMKLFEMQGLSGTIPFTGVLRIIGEKMSSTFRLMETAAHNNWVTQNEACRNNSKYYDSMQRELKRYIKKKIQKLFAPKTGDVVDAFGASDFLPDIIKSGDAKGKKESLKFKSTKIKIRRLKAIEQKVFNESEILESENFGNEGGHGHIRKPGNHKKMGKGKDHIGGTGDALGFEQKKIGSFRSICIDVKAGKYLVGMRVPATTNRAYLSILMEGEEFATEPNIKNALVVEGNATIYKVEKNKIYLENLQLGHMIKVEFSINFDRYCCLGVSYYATK